MNRAKKRRNKKLSDKAIKASTPMQAPSPTPATQQQSLAIQQAIDLGLQHHNAGDLPKAEGIYQQILQAEPKQPFALHFLGVINHQKGKSNIAADLIGQALAIKPDYAEAHNNLGLALQELEKLDDAVASYHKALIIKPDFSEARYNLGNAFLAQRKLDDAVASYHKALAIRPDYAEAHNNLGNALKEQGKLDDAITSYRNSLNVRPKAPDAHSNLGLALKELGNLDDAVASYRKALTIKPNYAEAHYSLGNVFLEQGRLDEAVASYREALAINSEYTDAHRTLGDALQKLGKLDDALASYYKAVAIKPDYAEAHNNLGVVFQELGKLEDAVASYHRALTIKPDYPEALYGLGGSLQELGKLDEAINSYITAVRLKPDYSDAHYNLGVILSEIGNHKKSAVHFRLSNLEKSQSYILRCLYLQNEQSLFYEQLDYLLNKGEINAMIGSLSCRAATKYGIERENIFCKDPITYVLRTGLKDKYDFDHTFIKTSKNMIYNNKSEFKSQELLINGHQTAGNLFSIKNSFTDTIQRIIHLEIKNYRNYFKKSKEGFITNWPNEYNIYGWLISIKSGGKLHPHIHERGWISGSMYINVPPKLKADSGNLVVCIDDEKSLKKTINVVTGDLCLFPSSLFHYTIPFQSDEERIVLAFDVVPI